MEPTETLWPAALLTSLRALCSACRVQPGPAAHSWKGCFSLACLRTELPVLCPASCLYISHLWAGARFPCLIFPPLTVGP